MKDLARTLCRLVWITDDSAENAGLAWQPLNSPMPHCGN
mgnify:CR=1 FL=1